jgi:hypothetical protein
MNTLQLHHFNTGSFMHSLDQVRKEPESEVQAGQVLVKASTNVALDQGKPGCIIPPIILSFFF